MNPFTYMEITQGCNGFYSHQGSNAIDVTSGITGKKAPYYAPCTIKCVAINKKYAFTWWQTINKVHFADGSISYGTFMFGHDNTINAKMGQVISQGTQVGNMGNGGNATGIHCHVEVSKTHEKIWVPNSRGVYVLPNSISPDSAFFCNDTTLANNGNPTGSGNKMKWKLYEESAALPSGKKLYLPASATSWRVYKEGVKPIAGNEIGKLNPNKFGGLTYDILGYSQPDVVLIQTRDYGKVQIYVAPSTGAQIK